jgi:lectin, mannose-binding 2
MTGDVSDNHECVHMLTRQRLLLIPDDYSVVSITTYSALLSSVDAPRDQFRNNRPTDAGSSWSSTLLKFVLFIGVAAGLLYGYRTYTLRQAGKGLGSGMGRGGSGLGSPFYDSKRF